MMTQPMGLCKGTSILIPISEMGTVKGSEANIKLDTQKWTLEPFHLSENVPTYHI